MIIIIFKFYINVYIVILYTNIKCPKVQSAAGLRITNWRIV